MTVITRDGRKIQFDASKIIKAIRKSMNEYPPFTNQQLIDTEVEQLEEMTAEQHQGFFHSAVNYFNDLYRNENKTANQVKAVDQFKTLFDSDSTMYILELNTELLRLIKLANTYESKNAALTPDCFIDIHNREGNVLATPSEREYKPLQAGEILSFKGKDGTIIVEILESKITSRDNDITRRDYTVLCAVASYYAKNISPDTQQSMRITLKGLTRFIHQNSKCTDIQVQEVEQSVDRLRSTYIRFTVMDESLYPRGNCPREKTEGYFLEIRKHVDGKLHGQDVGVYYELIAPPLLYEFAIRSGQVNELPTAILKPVISWDTKKRINNTLNRQAIKQYVYDRIGQIKASKEKKTRSTTPTILLNTIIEKCSIILPEPRTKAYYTRRSQLIIFVQSVLDTVTKKSSTFDAELEQLEIKGYSVQQKGRLVTGFSIRA